MDQEQLTAGKERKKYLKLDEPQWEQVRTVVNDFFRQPENAAKATYVVLFREIEQKYPHINLKGSELTFKKHVASIDKLRENAGIKVHDEALSKEYRKHLHDIFHQILTGLSDKEFESIKFDEIIQRAHSLHPYLDINGRNRKTLAKHFPIKQLKSFAQAKRHAEAPVPLGHSGGAPEAPAAQALAATVIDGPRLGKIQGRLDVQDGRSRPPKRKRVNDVFDFSGDSDPCPGAAESSQPTAEDAAFDRGIPAPETQLAARDHNGPEISSYGATKACDGLSALLEYTSEKEIPNLSSNARMADPDYSLATGDEDGKCQCMSVAYLA